MLRFTTEEAEVREQEFLMKTSVRIFQNLRFLSLKYSADSGRSRVDYFDNLNYFALFHFPLLKGGAGICRSWLVQFLWRQYLFVLIVGKGVGMIPQVVSPSRGHWSVAPLNTVTPLPW